MIQSEQQSMGDAAPREREYFCGSYRPEDVRFLLTPMDLEPVDVLAKERLIQSGQRHYSEMLSREVPLSPAYLAMFDAAVARSSRRVAKDLFNLAAMIAWSRPGEITLLSLARAGTPVGVLLKHVLKEMFARDARHYCVSIIRDRGLDWNALSFVLNQENRAASGIVFVDGWTGKGAIAAELAASVEKFNQTYGVGVDASLFVLSDLAGVANAPTDEDFLIPPSMLNATVSGLVSRSILNEALAARDFHGCVYFRELAEQDVSRRYVETQLEMCRVLWRGGCVPSVKPVDPARGREHSARLLAEIRGRFDVADIRRIKPGIGEATRVLLRRVPDRLILRDSDDPDVAHLVYLAGEKGVPVEIDGTLPLRAVSIIKGIGEG